MADEPIVQSMITVESVEEVYDPDRPHYQRFIDVTFSNGAIARHAIDEDGQYFREVHQPTDGKTRDGRGVQTDVDPDRLPEVVDVWLENTIEAIENGDMERWDISLIRGE